jgi:hypothetical protein
MDLGQTQKWDTKFDLKAKICGTDEVHKYSYCSLFLIHSFRETSHSKICFYKVVCYFISSISKHSCYTKLHSVKKALFSGKINDTNNKALI